MKLAGVFGRREVNGLVPAWALRFTLARVGRQLHPSRRPVVEGTSPFESGRVGIRKAASCEVRGLACSTSL